MALSEHEQKVFKAFSSLLSHDLLGLSIHDQKESSHYSQFRWNGIKDAFRLKVAESPYCDSLSAAFAKVHDYKYIDHPTFKIAMEAEMKSMGLPAHEMEMGLKSVDSLISELDEKNPGEKDAGWNPAMEEIKDVTTNADSRDAKTSETFSGGGPAPKGSRKLQMESQHRARFRSQLSALEDALRSHNIGELVDWPLEKLQQWFEQQTHLGKNAALTVSALIDEKRAAQRRGR